MMDKITPDNNNIQNNIDYSIVIPIFNEEESIRELWSYISQTIDQVTGLFEIIFIDLG